MRVTQWLPLVGWCHVTTGLATVRGLGTIYLDDVDLEHLAEPVQACTGEFDLHVDSVTLHGMPGARGRKFDVTNTARKQLAGVDLASLFPIQDVLCYGEGAHSLAELREKREAEGKPPLATLSVEEVEAELGAGGAVPFAMLLNAHVRDAMPLIHLGASVALGGAAVLVAASLAALLCAVLGVAAFINESPPAILRVGLAATAAASLLLLLGWSNPFPAAVGCFGALVLLGAWRVLVCGFGQLRAALCSPWRALLLALSAGSAAYAGKAAYALLAIRRDVDVELPGAQLEDGSECSTLADCTTGERPLLLLGGLTAAAAGMAIALAPLCVATTLWGLCSLGGAVGKVAPEAAASRDAGKAASTEERIRARLDAFEALDGRLNGLPRCYVYMLAAIALSGFVLVFLALEWSRQLNSRTHYAGALT
ncbi:hypothetical protein EMIHUDRAFT_443376 [Emiliania huxleyi CCMP1516]|uniref:Transmembrane protein n=2 Tax=Emiliania huxleyi TaxID=2903 RepID=A0A0D3JTA0_EMIH1|nr:hypothetical protein EMIHUDRAFT_443376 [Emiliania huxleyi CCMP1516]EOD26735.1 hypothetical protein EMIHUDRAFT_443376 [Emiliania huxleyi CCMP1516]|eukprot:XP_005779164.1 hypothetical protein EMIHUDRAFT_443376 [Emiliania huxleyi CCMP1516]